MNLATLRTKAASDTTPAGVAARKALAALDARQLTEAKRHFVAAASLDLDYADGVVSVSAVERSAAGGRSKSARKVEAVRANGKKGGRPKKTRPKE